MSLGLLGQGVSVRVPQPPAVVPVSACSQPCPLLIPLSRQTLSCPQGKEQDLPCWCRGCTVPSQRQLSLGGQCCSRFLRVCCTWLPAPGLFPTHPSPAICPHPASHRTPTSPPPPQGSPAPRNTALSPGLEGNAGVSTGHSPHETQLGTSPKAWEVAAVPLPPGRDSHRRLTHNEPCLSEHPRRRRRAP